MPFHHIKGEPSSSTYVREKGGLTFYTNRETPCSFILSILTISSSLHDLGEHDYDGHLILYNHVQEMWHSVRKGSLRAEVQWGSGKDAVILVLHYLLLRGQWDVMAISVVRMEDSHSA